MSPNPALHARLTRAGRRIRAILVIRWIGRACCAAAGTALLWLLAARAHMIAEPSPAALAALLGGALAAGIALGFAPRVDLHEVARLADLRADTKDRLASALELERGAATPLAQPQIRDAADRAESLDLARLFPLRPAREAAAAVLLAGVLVGMWLLPSSPLFWPRAKREEQAQVQRRGVEIERIARDAEKTAVARRLEETRRAAREARKLAEAMKKGRESKKTALVKLHKLTRDLEARQKQLARENGPGSKSLEKAGAEMRQALEQRQKAAAEALRQRQAQGRGPEATRQGAERQKALEALEKFATATAAQQFEGQNQALQELASQLEQGGLSPADMREVQQALQNLARSLQGTSQDRAAQELAKLAKQMNSPNLDPEMLKQLARMARQAGGT